MAKEKKGTIYIGTSNIVVPGNKQTFPTTFRDKSRLNYYSSLFNSVELNSPFYKVPMPSTFEKWSLDVPADFRFSIKLWKELTHVKALKIDPGNIELFMKAAERMAKKGCLLIQFPGKITLDYFNHVELILERLSDADPLNKWQKAIEFRHDSWYARETYELLNEHKATLVLHDIAKGRNAELRTDSDVVYVRYHGPTGNYRDSYTDGFLKSQSGMIKQWLKEGKDVYAYFNNTIGNAFENARLLRELVN